VGLCLKPNSVVPGSSEWLDALRTSGVSQCFVISMIRLLGVTYTDVISDSPPNSETSKPNPWHGQLPLRSVVTVSLPKQRA
jgi:hypothetical protein